MTIHQRSGRPPAAQPPGSETTPERSVVVGQLTSAHAAAVRPLTLRRRSLTAAMTAALLASWTLVENRLDDHLLVNMAVLRSTPAGGTAGRPDDTLYEELVGGIAAWLDDFARMQAVTWQTPTRLMARTLLATFDGLILDYATTRDAEGARQLVGLLGYHLAQSGLRRTKVVSRRGGDD